MKHIVFIVSHSPFMICIDDELTPMIVSPFSFAIFWNSQMPRPCSSTIRLVKKAFVSLALKFKCDWNGLIVVHSQDSFLLSTPEFVVLIKQVYYWSCICR
jgi:hypothetical protein